MNLHPVTLLFVLILAAFFYSQGQLFFLMATLVIGFLLLLSSATSPSPSTHGHASSVYPENMTIEVKGPEPPPIGGQDEFAKNVAGGTNFLGNSLGGLLNIFPRVKEDKEDSHGSGHGGINIHVDQGQHVHHAANEKKGGHDDHSNDKGGHH